MTLLSLPLLTPPPATEWLLSGPLFSLVVNGSIVGLALATITIVLIWVVEWRNGKVW